ncbi:MAG: tetratricopeptide repeat protein [Spirochaetes bacterium]|nr:tetratricopeptide repeat protein [Spirochaetota bacterium]
MTKKISFLLIIITLVATHTFSAPDKNWLKEEEKARKLFKAGKTDEAIILFREIILSSNNEKVKKESYFWLALAYMNTDKYDLAEKYLEYYLTNYQKDSANYAEANYQKGRLLFLQEQYQSSIDQLNLFIKIFPDDSLIPNAYYWIGESLYALGQFDDSAFFFHIVIEKYPNSFKREASIYKLKLIEHKKSELTLQNLLKWSQEQFIATLNKLKIKEKTLSEALQQYQSGSSDSDGNNSERIAQLLAEKQLLENKITELENRIQILEQAATGDDSALAEKMKQLELRTQLLNQKEEALRLLEEKLKDKEQSLE